MEGQSRDANICVDAVSDVHPTVNEKNIGLILSCLKVGGKISIATDVKNYFDFAHQLFENKNMTEILNIGKYNIRPNNIVSTRYEKKAKSNKREPFYLELKKKSG